MSRDSNETQRATRTMSSTMRTLHRWLSAAFTLAVVANFVAMATMGQSEEATWVGLAALVPLIPLLLTGIYLFLLPYLRRSGAPSSAA